MNYVLTKLFVGKYIDSTSLIALPALAQFVPGFFLTLKDRKGGGGGRNLANRHNSCISSQIKLKLGSNTIWVMFNLKPVEKLTTP